MNKRLILPYVLVIGAGLVFSFCQCMRQPDKDLLVISSNQKPQMSNSAYFIFYEKIDKFLESTKKPTDDQAVKGRSQALHYAKEAVVTIQKFSSKCPSICRVLLNDFLQELDPSYALIKEVKCAVNAVYFAQYPDDFPRAYKWIEQLQDANNANSLCNFDAINRYNDLIEMHEKIENLLFYQTRLKDLPEKEAVISNCRLLDSDVECRQIVDDLISWFFQMHDEDTLFKITAVASEFYKNIIQTMTGCVEKLSLKKYEFKDYFEYSSTMLGYLNILRKNNEKYQKFLGNDGTKSEKENVQANIDNIMKMMECYSVEIVDRGVILKRDIEQSIGIAKDKSLEEVEQDFSLAFKSLLPINIIR